MAEILLQRTPANRVAKLFPELINKFPSPRSIANANSDGLREFLRPIGLRKRVEWLMSLMKEVCDKYECGIPDREDELIKLTGVGLYTARAVLCFGFAKDVSIVDVNVSRVLSRVFLGFNPKNKASEDKRLWKLADELVPKGAAILYNEALLDHAILICRQNPLCNKCPVTSLCRYFERFQKRKIRQKQINV